MEGNMRGPSSVDCEKSYVRTGIVSTGMRARANSKQAPLASKLIQIRPCAA